MPALSQPATFSWREAGVFGFDGDGVGLAVSEPQVKGRGAEKLLPVHEHVNLLLAVLIWNLHIDPFRHDLLDVCRFGRRVRA